MDLVDFFIGRTPISMTEDRQFEKRFFFTLIFIKRVMTLKGPF
ncbi:MAG: hypothetical protein N2513_03915 [Deltaproteobacteria bacterium]|nr:hypothetical protein [Deltaproteobacteria bacterium]